jgi:hypothetical protein
MRQAICINAYVAFDARHKLAPVKAFLFGCICILHALRVNDQKSCVGIPTKALSDLANHIFLMRPPEGYLRLPSSGSISQNKRSNFPMRGTLQATFSTGIRFSAHIEPRRIPHINQAFLASFSFSLFPKQVGLSSQILLG